MDYAEHAKLEIEQTDLAFATLAFLKRLADREFVMPFESAWEFVGVGGGEELHKEAMALLDRYRRAWENPHTSASKTT